MAVRELVHGVQLLFGGGEGGFEARDLAEPALALGLGDAGMQVVADLDKAVPLLGVRPKLRARRAKVAGAYTEGDLAQLEGTGTGPTRPA